MRILSGALGFLLILMCLRATEPVNHAAAALIGSGAGLILAAFVLRRRAGRRKRPETLSILRAAIGVGLFALAAAVAWVQRGLDITFALAVVVGFLVAQTASKPSPA